jgi:EmrB/QacA subfamily drug resistance transporter
MKQPTDRKAEMADETRKPARPGVVLAVVCTGVILSSLDLFIVNVALPQISRGFHGASLSDLSWVLNAYAVVFAALLVPAGRLADRAGRRGGFLIGVAIFTASSAACALANSVVLLVAFRITQAAGAALLIPTSLGLVLAAYPPERRAGAVRIWTATSGLAAAAGPVLGGVLVQASWRWVFIVNVPIGIAAIVAGRRVLPRPPAERGPLPDLLGAVLLTGGIGALTLGLVKAHDWDWGSGRILGALAGATVCLVIFVLRSARHRSPVIELSLLRERGYGVTLLAAALFSTAFGAMLLSIVLWLQDDWHWSALQAGLAVFPGPLMVPGLSILSGRLSPRFSPGLVIAAGCALFAAGMLWWRTAIGLQPDYVRGILPGMLLTGIGVGLALPTLFAAASSSLPPARFATGSAVINMARQIGFVVGVAVLVAILGAPGTARGRLDAFDRSWLVVAAIAVAGGLIALTLGSSRRAAGTARALAAVRR